MLDLDDIDVQVNLGAKGEFCRRGTKKLTLDNLMSNEMDMVDDDDDDEEANSDFDVEDER